MAVPTARSEESRYVSSVFGNYSLHCDLRRSYGKLTDMLLSVVISVMRRSLHVAIARSIQLRAISRYSHLKRHRTPRHPLRLRGIVLLSRNR